MKNWMLPLLMTLFCWGLQGFIAKLTTRYIDAFSALLYNIIGALLVGCVALFMLQFKPAVHQKGIFLAVIMGSLGILGALGFLLAVTDGKVSIVAVLSSLYPIVTIGLAWWILKEPVSLKEGIGMCLALIAIVLLSS
jgi:transporter family protein